MLEWHTQLRTRCLHSGRSNLTAYRTQVCCCPHQTLTSCDAARCNCRAMPGQSWRALFHRPSIAGRTRSLTRKTPAGCASEWVSRASRPSRRSVASADQRSTRYSSCSSGPTRPDRRPVRHRHAVWPGVLQPVQLRGCGFCAWHRTNTGALPSRSAWLSDGSDAQRRDQGATRSPHRSSDHRKACSTRGACSQGAHASCRWP